MTKSELIARLAAALSAAGGEGRRVRGEDDPRRDDAEPAQRASHRDPRLRQLRPQLPAAAHRPQPEVRREGAGAGEVRAALQGRQGAARAGRLLDPDATVAPPRSRQRASAAAFARLQGTRPDACRHLDDPRRSCSSLLLAFAAKNTEPVTLRFYFDLALAGAAGARCCSRFFAAGALLGVLAVLGTAAARSAGRSRACSAVETAGRSRQPAPPRRSRRPRI